MKCIALLFCSLLLPANGQEKPLSELDRELLLEKLKEVQGTSDSTVKGRYGVALSAFRKARESSAAAHELYLNCIEKVRFEDQLRKTSEFRDWKKRHKERGDSPAFRLALRHQLNWLVLTLEAAQVDDISVLSTRGVGVLESIIRDAEDLKGQDQLLRSDPLSSIFADAYSVGTIEIDTWPKSPLDIADLYENVILPPCELLKHSTPFVRRGSSGLNTKETCLRNGPAKRAVIVIANQPSKNGSLKSVQN